jgi:hypothetical protein
MRKFTVVCYGGHTRLSLRMFWTVISITYKQYVSRQFQHSCTCFANLLPDWMLIEYSYMVLGEIVFIENIQPNCSRPAQFGWMLNSWLSVSSQSVF